MDNDSRPPAPKDGPERRAARRAVPRIPISAVRGDGEQAWVLDLTELGMRVGINRPAAVGETHTFTFRVGAAGATLTLAATVRHVAQLADQAQPSFSVGLQFEEPLTHAQREAIGRLAGLDV